MIMECVLSVLASTLLSLPPAEALSQNQEFWFRQLKSESPDLKINALDKLGELKNLEAVARIAQALDDSDPEVRFHAIRAMAKNPAPETVAALQERIQPGQALEKDPYLVAEIKRTVRELEDTMKASAAAAEKKATKAASPKPAKKKTRKK